MVYLFLGKDEIRKQERIEQLKKIYLNEHLKEFDYEVFTSKQLTLKKIQESLARLPALEVHPSVGKGVSNRGASDGKRRRLILIRDIQKAAPKIKEFFISYSKRPFAHVVLILVAGSDVEEESILPPYSSGNIKIEKFGSFKKTNAFDLGKAIAKRNAKFALCLLSQLLEKGEKPEKILGGLRYQLLKGASTDIAREKNLFVLLNTELDIKTGRLLPHLALEKLIIKLCCF